MFSHISYLWTYSGRWKAYLHILRKLVYYFLYLFWKTSAEHLIQFIQDQNFYVGWGTIFFFIKSNILPGVPKITWIPPSKIAFFYSLLSIPPTLYRDFTFVNSPILTKVLWFDCDISRAGAIMIAWQKGMVGSMRWRTPIEWATDLPYPDCACIMVSLLVINGIRAFCWIK